MADRSGDEKIPEEFTSGSEAGDEKESLLKSSEDASPIHSRSLSPELASDSRFPRATPSPFRRAALLVSVGLLLWMIFQMRLTLFERKPQVIHASRYSKEHKYRPAASPIITETLKDGRIRLRGALQTPTAVPTTVGKIPKKKGKGKRANRRKVGGKRP